jgi:uncharacterized repeat protein (TIGR01451 family)
VAGVVVAIAVFLPFSVYADEVPPPGPFAFQTDGPNAAVGLGDWYTSTAPGAGSGYHYLTITVPCGWPAAAPVHIDLFSPEMNRVADVLGGNEEPNGNYDSTQFELYPPGTAIGPGFATPAPGTGIAGTRTTFQPGPPLQGERYVRYATLDPVSCGTYVLRSEVLASDPLNPLGEGNDQNGWRVRVGADDDADPNTPPPANYDDPDGVPGTNDEIITGLVQTTLQHNAAGTQCRNEWEYVPPGVPSITFHNFDFDGNGRIRYYPPSEMPDPTALTGGIAGTISNPTATWNGSNTISRGGDTIASPETGWWAIVSCISSNNQYIEEGQLGVPLFLEQPPTPSLDVTKDDGVTQVRPRDVVTYTIVVTNTSTGATAGAANQVVATDTIPAQTSFVSCQFVTPAAGTCSESGGQVTATLSGWISAGESISIEVTIRVDDDASGQLTNSVSVDYEDALGNPFVPVSDSDTDEVIPVADLSIQKSHTGDFTAGRNGRYLIEVTNLGPSAAAGPLTVTDQLPPSLSFVSATGSGWTCAAAGDTVTCTRAAGLAPGESTSFTLVVAVASDAPRRVRNNVTVSSVTEDPDAGNNSDEDRTRVSRPPPPPGGGGGDSDGDGTGGTGEGGAAGGALPFSGFPLDTYTLAGTTLLAAGSLLVRMGRPRRRHARARWARPR